MLDVEYFDKVVDKSRWLLKLRMEYDRIPSLARYTVDQLDLEGGDLTK
jgi:hypothetical protein